MQKKRYFKKPYRVKRGKSIFQNRFLGLGILIFVFIALLSYILFFSEIFQIKKIIISGEKKVSKGELELSIEKKLENKILFFRTKSIFLVNLKEIRKGVLNNFPQIAEVEVSRGFPGSLYVLVRERLGLALWQQGEEYFLLAPDGVIFEEVLAKMDLIKIIARQNITPFALGEKVIDKKLLSQILEIASFLKEDLKILVAEVSIITKQRLNIKTSEDWEIYLNPEGDINWQLTKLRVVLEEEIPPQTREDLEYIELRFGNFAPYKYRDY